MTTEVTVATATVLKTMTIDVEDMEEYTRATTEEIAIRVMMDMEDKIVTVDPMMTDMGEGIIEITS